MEMTKTADLTAIATGRTPKSILKTALRVGVLILIKERKAEGK
jgi:hypothetical protein